MSLKNSVCTSCMTEHVIECVQIEPKPPCPGTWPSSPHRTRWTMWVHVFVSLSVLIGFECSPYSCLVSCCVKTIVNCSGQCGVPLMLWYRLCWLIDWLVDIVYHFMSCLRNIFLFIKRYPIYHGSNQTCAL